MGEREKKHPEKNLPTNGKVELKQNRHIYNRNGEKTMTTLLLATAIFVIVSIATAQPRKLSVISKYTEEGWEEPTELEEMEITDNIVPFTRRIKADPYATFNPSEWVFDCGLTTQPVIVTPSKQMTRRELLAIAKDRKVKKYSRMTTLQLKEVISA